MAKDNYSERCPDCHADGGDGKRCPEHELAMIEYEMNCLKNRKEELLKEMENADNKNSDS